MSSCRPVAPWIVVFALALTGCGAKHDKQPTTTTGSPARGASAVKPGDPNEGADTFRLIRDPVVFYDSDQLYVIVRLNRDLPLRRPPHRAPRIDAYLAVDGHRGDQRLTQLGEPNCFVQTVPLARGERVGQGERVNITLRIENRFAFHRAGVVRGLFLSTDQLAPAAKDLGCSG